MGFQTTVIFDNDHLGLLQQDPDIGQKIALAISKASTTGNCPVPVNAVGERTLACVAHVIESHHADRQVLLCAKDLTATVLKIEIEPDFLTILPEDRT